MTGIIPDELATAAANEVYSLSLEQTLNLHIEDCEAITRVVLEAVGLPPLLERVEAADVLAVVRQRDEWYRKFAEMSVERDALAAKVANAGERIAVAIETESEIPKGFPAGHPVVLAYQGGLDQAARIARAALTETAKP